MLKIKDIANVNNVIYVSAKYGPTFFILRII